MSLGAILLTAFWYLGEEVVRQFVLLLLVNCEELRRVLGEAVKLWAFGEPVADNCSLRTSHQLVEWVMAHVVSRLSRTIVKEGARFLS